MLCLECGGENREARRFCAACGAILGVKCPRCGFLNHREEKFCGGCGSPSLAPSDDAGQTGESVVPSVVRRVASIPERRQLTLLFCDLVGSTALSEVLDPEDLIQVLRAYQECSAKVAARFDGIVARYVGDGIQIYFGYPQAHEDDAERALHAGLGIIEEVSQLQPRPGIKLQVRIGVATGLVVVGDMVGAGVFEERAVMGDPPNLAARLQTLAQPNSMVIAPSTYKLAGGAFHYRDLGEHELKGFSKPIQVREVIGVRTVDSRFEAAHGSGLTPLVNREHELALLYDRWAKAKRGDGQVVLLCGEAGIGKSRVAQALRERIASEPCTRLRFQCSPYFTKSALYPIIDHLEKSAEFDTNDGIETKLKKLEALLGSEADSNGLMVALCADLLSIPTDDHYAPLEMAAEEQKDATFKALIGRIEKLAQQQPVLIILEDAHWVDPTSLELFDLLVDLAKGSKMLAIVTYRPEFVPIWTDHQHVTELPHGRLSPEEGEVLVGRVAAGRPLPPEVVEQLVEKSDGIPLFVEELTNAVLESDLLNDVSDDGEIGGPIESLSIPSTLHDSLMARLDRLAPIKLVAQMGATIGREFSFDLLAKVADMDEGELQEALDRLAASGLVFRRGSRSNPRYIFKHALVQDTAYKSLLRSKRQSLHARIAEALEQHFPATAEAEPELMANHYLLAGLGAQSVRYWAKAAEQAAERSANLEAIHHFSKGIELIHALPPRRELLETELWLQIGLGGIEAALHGFGEPQVGKTYSRALEICRDIGEPLEPTLQAISGMAGHYYVSGQLRDARPLAEQCLLLAKQLEDHGELVEAHRLLGELLFFMGELRDSREHLEKSIALYDREKHRKLKFISGDDPCVSCTMYLSIVLWLLGFPDEGLSRCRDGLKLARDLGHPSSLAQAEFYASWFHAYRRELAETKEHAEASIAICSEHKFELWLALSLVLRGWALSRLGQLPEGVDQMRTGMDLARQSHAGTCVTCFLPWLTEGLGMIGNMDHALDTLGEAVDTAVEISEHVHDAERLRIKGDLLSKKDRNGREAEACYREAMDLAHAQGMRSIELRAALSLARRCQSRQENEQARRLLEPLICTIAEGLDTPDLKDANNLLSAL